MKYLKYRKEMKYGVMHALGIPLQTSRPTSTDFQAGTALQESDMHYVIEND